jgi:Na+-transporting methylmalonyl-CoA/oxaloacetate decarboxylase gamma subunit
MYCPVCGSETIQGLKYCKQCGANLSPSNIGVGFNKITGLFWAVAIFGIGSFALLIGGGVAVTALHAGGSDLAAVIGVGFLVVLVISIMLIWQVSRIITMAHKSERAESSGKTDVIKERDTQPQLASPPLTMPSVTEHTTRNFEPSLDRERDARK